MPIIVGIDGTGGGALPTAARDRRYDEDFKNSFVKKICKPAPNSKYFRGPVTFGGGLMDAIAGGYRFVMDRRKVVGDDMPVLLTGYSRGAAGAVCIAKRLNDSGVKVRALMLFDCVDRHIGIDASVIPRNVEHVCHVVRDPLSESRESFSNDGLKYYPPTDFPAAYSFMCTHGGMGGTPWKVPNGSSPTDFIDEGFPDGMTKITYRQDEFVSQSVWTFVKPFLKTHGFITE
ncbi:MAG TPA: DUF2235 domain-containing protein [Pyrinomonadaceae bacterium]|nr:DUF2235 domain-containing protein [Pyrinomonadaceae bacterium]